MAEGTVRSTGVAAFWKQFGYRIAHIEVENEGILVKVTSAQEYEERRQIFAEKQIRGHVKVSLAVNRSFFGSGCCNTSDSDRSSGFCAGGLRKDRYVLQ